MSGYSCLKQCRSINSKINRYFGGLSIYYRSELRPGIRFLEHKNNDYAWLKLCKSFFGTARDTYLCLAYIPPENSTYYRSRGEDTLQLIEQDILKYSELGSVSLAGDLNARTKNVPDFIENDREETDSNNAFYLVDEENTLRNSQDQVPSCARGKQLLELCISARLRILNGRCIGDSMGIYTCHQYNGSSVVDYVLTDEENIKNILYMQVKNYFGDLADHCCLSWAMRCNYTISHVNTHKKYGPFTKGYKWDNRSISNFQTALTRNDITSKVLNFAKATLTEDREGVEMAVRLTNDIYICAANIALKRKPHITKNKNKKHKQWFNQSLVILKREVDKLSNQLQKTPNIPEVRSMFFKTLKLYNKKRKKCAKRFKEATLAKLDDLRSSDPQAYWKLLKSLKDARQSDANEISMEDWLIHFQNLNNPTIQLKVMEIKTTSLKICNN